MTEKGKKIFYWVVVALVLVAAGAVTAYEVVVGKEKPQVIVEEVVDETDSIQAEVAEGTVVFEENTED